MLPLPRGHDQGDGGLQPRHPPGPHRARGLRPPGPRLRRPGPVRRSRRRPGRSHRAGPAEHLRLLQPRADLLRAEALQRGRRRPGHRARTRARQRPHALQPQPHLRPGGRLRRGARGHGPGDQHQPGQRPRALQPRGHLRGDGPLAGRPRGLQQGHRTLSRFRESVPQPLLRGEYARPHPRIAGGLPDGAAEGARLPLPERRDFVRRHHAPVQLAARPGRGLREKGLRQRAPAAPRHRHPPAAALQVQPRPRAGEPQRGALAQIRKCPDRTLHRCGPDAHHPGQHGKHGHGRANRHDERRRILRQGPAGAAAQAVQLGPELV